MKNIFVYGSLKEGEYNFGRFGETNVLQKNVKINGFLLYSLGPYPCVVKTNNPEDFVIGEIHEVSEGNYNNIARMEFGAGYYSEELKFGEISATIFPMKNNNLGYYKAKLIPEGIW
jgi:gamma-glutamylcyclotransferase (GGCT)/AIG2-like uncharacterized protein YtfP